MPRSVRIDVRYDAFDGQGVAPLIGDGLEGLASGWVCK